jgi:hypothetical protein
MNLVQMVLLVAVCEITSHSSVALGADEPSPAKKEVGVADVSPTNKSDPKKAATKGDLAKKSSVDKANKTIPAKGSKADKSGQKADKAKKSPDGTRTINPCAIPNNKLPECALVNPCGPNNNLPECKKGK